MTISKVDVRDKIFVSEFAQDLSVGLDDVPLTVFLCGSGLPSKRSNRKDIRTYLEGMLQTEIKSCRVKLGEHKVLIRTYATAVGGTATNLADHEMWLASKTDLLIIFPSSAGSFAELGMFCLQNAIARKMVVFVSRRYKRSNSFVVNGPVAAARRRDSKVYYVNYSHRTEIWKRVKSLVLDIRANKGTSKLLQT